MLTSLANQAATFGFYTLAFLFVLTIIVFVHEFGHFIVARWNGVTVQSFAIGFGKEVAGFTDRYGTRWKVGWLPLGGYVKFEGDANAASLPKASSLDKRKQPPGNFYGKNVAQRASVVAAGPLANFILAIIIFTISFMIVGIPRTEPRVDSVQPGSPAESAGIQSGDLIRRINGSAIYSFDDIQRIVMPRAGETLIVQVERGGAVREFQIVPESREIDDGFGGRVRIGLMGVSRPRGNALVYERKNPVEALELGFTETWRIIAGSMHFIKRVVTGQENANQLGGAPGHCSNIREGGRTRILRTHANRRDVVGQHRTDQFVPGPYARRGASVILRHRVRTRPATWAKRAGMGIPGRICPGFGAYVLRDVERPGACFRLPVRTRLRVWKNCRILGLQWAENNGKGFGGRA